MKVLVLTEQGTSNRITDRAIVALRDSGIDVTFASTGPKGALHESFSRQGIPNVAFNAVRSLHYPGAILRLSRYIRSERFDVVHSAEPIPAALGGLAALLAQTGKRIFHRQHLWPENPGAWKQQLFSRVGTISNQLIMACSAATKRVAEDRDRIPSYKIMVAENGSNPVRLVRHEESESLKRSLGIEANEKVVVILSRLRKVKGHETLFSSIPMVAGKLSAPLHLIVAGSGPDEERFRRIAESIAEAKIHFVGFQEDVALWFSVADAIAMPSYWDALPFAAIEAMFCARPIVASRVGGFCEIIKDGVNGILVEPKDPDALAEGLTNVLTNPAFGRELGEKAKETAEARFSTEQMANRWVVCYERILGTKSG